MLCRELGFDLNFYWSASLGVERRVLLLVFGWVVDEGTRWVMDGWMGCVANGCWEVEMEIGSWRMEGIDRRGRG